MEDCWRPPCLKIQTKKTSSVALAKTRLLTSLEIVFLHSNWKRVSKKPEGLSPSSGLDIEKLTTRNHQERNDNHQE
jgi:hypothetical protein